MLFCAENPMFGTVTAMISAAQYPFFSCYDNVISLHLGYAGADAAP